jgi:outer membrane protein TolC
LGGFRYWFLFLFNSKSETIGYLISKAEEQYGIMKRRLNFVLMQLFTGLMYLMLCGPMALCSGSFEATPIYQIVAYGLTHAPKLRALEETSKIDQLNLENAEAAFFPTVEGSMQGGMGGRKMYHPAEGASGYSLGPMSQAQVTVSQPLWDFGVKSSQNQQSRIKSELGRQNAAKMRSQIILDIILAYLDFSLAEAAWKGEQYAVSMSEKELKALESTFRQGRAQQSQVQRFRTEHQRLVLTADLAQREWQSKRSRLELLIGLEKGDESLRLTSLSVPAGASSSTEMQKSLKHLSEDCASFSSMSASFSPIAMEQTQEKLASEYIDEQRKRFIFPKLNLSASSALGHDDIIRNDGVYSTAGQNWRWAVTLDLKYTFYDAGTSRRNLELVLLDVNQKKFERQAQSQEYEQLRSEAVRYFDDQKKQMDIALELMNLDEKTYQASLRDYQKGLMSTSDFLDSMNKLHDSRLALTKVYFSLLRSYWTIAYYAGVIDEKATKNL